MRHFQIRKASLLDSISNMDLEFLKLEMLVSFIVSNVV